MKRMRTRIAVLSAAACAAAIGDILVVPNPQANAAGNIPLQIKGNPSRIQEVVGSGQFTQPITINALRVRAFPGSGQVHATFSSLKITMSTTQAYPNTNGTHTLPSSTFANNVGPDATVVYNSALSFTSPGCPSPGPCPFDMVIPLAVPFSYDNSKGRLLIDLLGSTPTGVPAGQLDAVAYPDSTSGSVAIVLGDPAATTGSVDVGGLVFGLETTTSTTQAPTVGAVLNTFSSGPELCPGMLASVFGTNFGSAAAAVTVTVGSKQAFVTFASPGQLVVQIPFEATVGATTLTVTVGGASSPPFNVTLATYAPAINTVAGTGTGLGVVRTSKNAQVTSTAPASPGDTLVIYVTGLGPSNPATPTGVTPASPARPTATAPTLKIGGADAKVLFAGLAAGSAGVYQINFTVPSGLQGSQPMVITIGGVSTKAVVTVPLFGLTSIVNNASQSSPGTAAAGSFVTIKANGLGSADQLSGFPDTKFQGVQVTFGGIPAPLYHLIANPPSGATQTAQALFEQQIDLLVPNELPASGTVNVQLTTPAAFYPNYSLMMAPAVPGIYRIADPSVPKRSNVIAQFNTTVWLAMPASMATALKLPGNCSNSTISPLSLCGQPATIGDYLVLYGTGLGITTPNGDPNGKPLATGVAPPADGSILYETPTTPSVTIGGIPVKVLYSGLPPGFIGLYQIVFQVPSGVSSGDDVPVTITMLGNSDTATVSIQPRPQ